MIFWKYFEWFFKVFVLIWEVEMMYYIVIVGGGVSGVIMVVNFFWFGNGVLCVILVEVESEIGKGVVYLIINLLYFFNVCVV